MLEKGVAAEVAADGGVAGDSSPGGRRWRNMERIRLASGFRFLMAIWRRSRRSKVDMWHGSDGSWLHEACWVVGVQNRRERENSD